MVCSPIDATLVATGGGDDKGFMWKIGRGDFAQELSGVCMILQIVIYNFLFYFSLPKPKGLYYVSYVPIPPLPWLNVELACLSFSN